MNTLKRIFPLATCCLLLLHISCKKVYETAPTPYNEITSFKIPYDGGRDTLIGHIVGANIHIAWPGSTQWPIPQTVSPKIATSKNAIIAPASNTPIALKDGYQYTVTAQDGSTKVYTIKLVNAAALPTLLDQNTIQTRKTGELISFGAKNLAADGSDEIYLVDDTNREYKLLRADSLKTTTGINVYIDRADGSGIPTGEYYVTLKNKFQIPVKSENKIIKVTEGSLPYIYSNQTATLEVKLGATFSIPVRHFKAGYDVGRVQLNTSLYGYIDLEYVGYNATNSSITVRIPLDTPLDISPLYDANPLMISITENGDFLGTFFGLYNPYQIKIVE